MKIPDTHLYSAYKALMGKEASPTPPPLTTITATLVLIAYTVIYVAPFYFSAATRPSARLNRSAELVIRARIRSVTTSTVICSLTTFSLLVHFSEAKTLYDATFNALHSMGYYPFSPLSILKSMTLLMVLFAGPLFEAGIVEGAWKDWVRLRGITGVFTDWLLYRNLIAGPITEELLFRSSSLPLYILSSASVRTLIFLTPLIFGLAHIHHIYESSFHVSLRTAILRSFVQLCYTSLFGGFVAFIYLRTGSLVAVILAHTFCNWMGLPRFWGRVGANDTSYAAEETVMGGEGKRGDDFPKTIIKRRSRSDLATVIYYVLLVGGSWVFYRYLWTLTESDNALMKF